jgi:16S rRNA (guanine527-N7)-methyltransferase
VEGRARGGEPGDERCGGAVARVAELVQTYGLPPSAQEPLERILRLLSEDGTAPTTVREPARAVDVHLADSLSGLELEVVRNARQIADLGAGAGFPGLALAVALPDARVFLVESVGKKCAFMERAIAAAGIDNAAVVCARAEEWREGIGDHDLVTARALAPLAVIAEYAAPLLGIGGSLVAWKGARDPREETDARAATAELGLATTEIRRVQPFPGAKHHHLHVYSKVMETPPRFPRRAGMARKRPPSA